MVIISIEETGIVCVIPAYNEEVAIGSVVLEAREYCDHVVVVNDGSVDDTSEIARLAGAEVLDLPKNKGKATALIAGLSFAGSNGFRAVVTMDGDGQHDPKQIGSIAAPVLNGEADLVIGSRFLGGSRSIPMYRKAGQKVLNGLTQVASEIQITDSQSGFRALSKDAIANLDFASTGYNIESDMICQFAERGLKVKEVPITAIYDIPNKHKKNPFAHGLSVMGRIVTLISQRRPLLIFGVPGFVLACIGLFLGIFSLLEVTIFGWGWLFQTLLAVFVFTLGSVMGVCALVLNSLSNLLGRMEGNTHKNAQMVRPSFAAPKEHIELENRTVREMNN